MNDHPTDRAIAQAFRERRNAAWLDNFNGKYLVEGIERRAREIDDAAPEGAQRAVAWVVGELPQLVHHYSEAAAMAEAQRYGLPITPLYTHPPADAEDAARYRFIRNYANRVEWIEHIHGLQGVQDMDADENMRAQLDAAIDAARDGEGA